MQPSALYLHHYSWLTAFLILRQTKYFRNPTLPAEPSIFTIFNSVADTHKNATHDTSVKHMSQWWIEMFTNPWRDTKKASQSTHTYSNHAMCRFLLPPYCVPGTHRSELSKHLSAMLISASPHSVFARRQLSPNRHSKPTPRCNAKQHSPH